MKNKIKEFDLKVKKNLKNMSKDKKLFKKSIDWMLHADKYKYTYNFQWAGIPVIKFPNDLIVLQEVISKVKPDVIIETGVAHGGSLVFSASMLELFGPKNSSKFTPLNKSLKTISSNEFNSNDIKSITVERVINEINNIL